MPNVTVPSPCRDICVLGTGEICIGCGRTAAEIAEWPGADTARRLAIRELARTRIEASLFGPRDAREE